MATRKIPTRTTTPTKTAPARKRAPAAVPAPAPKAAAKPATAAAPAPLTTAPVAKSAAPKPEKIDKAKKPKLVRDSFTIPKTEFAVLAQLKRRAALGGAEAKKSELLRAGIQALAAMNDAAFRAALDAVPTLKTGRPSKS